MFDSFLKKSLIDLLPRVRGKYLKNVPLSKHTWFGVGGPAEVLFSPEDLDDLSYFLKNKPYNVPLYVIGGGSNLLVRDGGIPGVVIKMESPYFRTFKINEGSITCMAGMKNIDLKKIFIGNGIGGLEFLCSIPGHIGGSVKTNAGCFGKCLKDVLLAADIIDGNGNCRQILPEDLQLSYRSSLFPDDWIITSVTLKTEPKEADEIADLLEEHRQYRITHQPYNEKTAGSTFKNPEGLSAWKLIKTAGCENLKIGGAKVSEKHCNFLINTGNATAADIETLGNTIVEKVKQKTSITLEWEVKKIGVGK